MKKHIILDLDQTLISSEEPKDLEKYFNLPKGAERTNKIENTGMSNYDMDDCFTVFERPELQDFLTYIFKNFNVSVWTAATKDYALSIIENVILGKGSSKKTGRKLEYIFFNYHCKISKRSCKKLMKDTHTKKLSILEDVFKIKNIFNLKNTVIIDDYEKVYDRQTGNCIIAPPFKFEHFTRGTDKKDTFLSELTNTHLPSWLKGGDIKDINKAIINKYKLTTHGYTNEN